jgi:hypothetical protein
MKLGERDSFAADLGVPIIDCWVMVDAHGVSPSKAWNGGREKISLRLFHGELAGRTDLEQAGRTSSNLYERLS